jgi:hypothetical protein
MAAACWFTYLLVVLQKVRGISSYKAGIVLLAGQVAVNNRNRQEFMYRCTLY